MNIHYRSATAADIPALARLGADTFIDTFGHLYSTDDLNSFLHEMHSISGVAREFATPGMAYHLALDGATPIGYCKLGPCGLPVPASARTAAELKQMYVHKSCFGSGVGATLMNWAMNEFHARQCDDIYLSVWNENSRAQKFYAKYGFVKIGDYRFKVGEQLDYDFIFHHRITP
jgi:diamine N-acetyltransferase